MYRYLIILLDTVCWDGYSQTSSLTSEGYFAKPTKAECGGFLSGEEENQKHAFCETNPFVMCIDTTLTRREAMCCVEHNEDYKWVRFPRNQHRGVYSLRRLVELGHDHLTRNGRTLQLMSVA